MTLRDQVVQAFAKFPDGATSSDIAVKIGRSTCVVRACVSKAFYYGFLMRIGQRGQFFVYKVAPPPPPMRYRPGINP